MNRLHLLLLVTGTFVVTATACKKTNVLGRPVFLDSLHDSTWDSVHLPHDTIPHDTVPHDTATHPPHDTFPTPPHDTFPHPPHDTFPVPPRDTFNYPPQHPPVDTPPHGGDTLHRRR